MGTVWLILSPCLDYWLLSSCLPVSQSMLLLCLMGGIIMETLLGSLTLLLRSMCGLDLSRRNSHLEARQTKLSRNSKNKDILNLKYHLLNIFYLCKSKCFLCQQNFCCNFRPYD